MKKMPTAVVPSTASTPSPPTSTKEPASAWPASGATPPPAGPRYASVRSRFSLAKMTRLIDYCRTTSTRRQLAVVLLFAVPSALTSLLSCVIPLRAPSPSIAENEGFWVHFVITFLLSYGGTMAQVRAAASIPHAHYTNADIALVAMAPTVPLTGLAFFVATYWRFPVPFSWVLIMTPWFLCLALGNALVLRSRLRALARPLLAYAPSLTVQVSQIAIYPAYSALFEAADAHQKIALVLFFPVLKWSLKKSIFALTRSSNHELSSEIAASGVEICASMYQSMIMQSTPSPLATALVIGLDVAHGLVDVRRSLTLRHDCHDGGGGTNVLTVLQRAVDAQPDERELARYGTRSGATALLSMWGSRRQASLVAVAPVARADDEHKAQLTQALEMLQAAETILLVEFIEVAVPLVNAVYLCVATQFESAVFNPKLRCFYGNPDALRAAVASVVLYTALQALTLGAMAVAVQRRLKLSALTLLAFVLERHAWSLQGKLVSWMCVLFVFSVVHYGVHFSFQFNFTTTVSSPSC